MTARGLKPVFVGLFVGLAVGLALAKTMSSLLFRVDARDPYVFLGVPILLTAVALISVYLPARRGTRTPPYTALRNG
jgi:putative ABC transport system permease protein